MNKYGVKCGISLRFWENKDWINKKDPYDWFHWYFRYWLGRRSKDDKRQVNRWKKIVRRFRGKLDQIVLSDKFKHNNGGFNYFIGYLEGGIVKPVCIILPQMSGYIKYLKMGVQICLF